MGAFSYSQLSMDATDWVALASMVTAAVGTLAGLMLHGFSNVNKRIDDTSRQLVEIRVDLSRAEQRTYRRVESLESLHSRVETVVTEPPLPG